MFVSGIRAVLVSHFELRVLIAGEESVLAAHLNERRILPREGLQSEGNVSVAGALFDRVTQIDRIRAGSLVCHLGVDREGRADGAADHCGWYLFLKGILLSGCEDNLLLRIARNIVVLFFELGESIRQGNVPLRRILEGDQGIVASRQIQHVAGADIGSRIGEQPAVTVISAQLDMIVVSGQDDLRVLSRSKGDGNERGPFAGEGQTIRLIAAVRRGFADEDIDVVADLEYAANVSQVDIVLAS